MTYTKQVDVLDMIIEVLREHEKVLDSQVARLEDAVNRLGTHMRGT